VAVTRSRRGSFPVRRADDQVHAIYNTAHRLGHSRKQFNMRRLSDEWEARRRNLRIVKATQTLSLGSSRLPGTSLREPCLQRIRSALSPPIAPAPVLKKIGAPLQSGHGSSAHQYLLLRHL